LTERRLLTLGGGCRKKMTIATIAVRAVVTENVSGDPHSDLEPEAQAMMTRDGDCDRGAGQLE
jgi:hypothetical protein